MTADRTAPADDGGHAGRLWLHDAIAYAVVTEEGSMANPWRSGLSHAAAMVIAEELRRAGRVAIVVHVVGDKSYEVDRYPAR